MSLKHRAQYLCEWGPSNFLFATLYYFSWGGPWSCKSSQTYRTWISSPWRKEVPICTAKDCYLQFLCACFTLSSISSVQLLSRVRLFVTPWTAACQASLSITISQSSLQLTSIQSVMSSNLLFVCRPLLLLPSTFASIRVFSNDLDLLIRWPKYLCFSISPSNEYSGLISFRIDWFDL